MRAAAAVPDAIEGDREQDDRADQERDPAEPERSEDAEQGGLVEVADRNDYTVDAGCVHALRR